MKVEAWLVLEGKTGNLRYASGPYQGQSRLMRITPVRITQGRPSNLNANQIAFRIELDVDEGWFLDQGSPGIVASVPAPPPDMHQTVQAQVDMPVKPRGKSPAANIVRH